MSSYGGVLQGNPPIWNMPPQFGSIVLSRILSSGYDLFHPLLYYSYHENSASYFLLQLEVTKGQLM